MRILFLLFSVLLIFSCQKKIVSERISWKKGDTAKTLELIEGPEWSKTVSEVEIKDEKILMTRQSFLGIPIENSYLKKIYKRNKRNNDTLELTQAEAQMTNPPALRMVRGLSFNEDKIIKDIQNQRNSFSKITIINKETVLIERDKQLVPALKISFFSRLGEPWSAYADKKDSIFQTRREGSQFDEKTSVEATIFPNGPKLSSLTDVLLTHLNIQPTLSSSEVAVTTEADKKIISIEESLKFDPKDVRFDQVQAFYYLNKSLLWMKEKFQISFPGQLEVVVHVGYPEKTNAAFYFQNKIRIGSGDDQVYTQISQDPSIVSHESFHYLIDLVAGLPYESEGGSLNEAFADFFTCVMLNRPQLGETAYMPGPYKRSLETTVLLSEKNGGLYHDSLIVSGLLWEISQKIGMDKTLNLAIAVLKHLHRFSDFADFNTQLSIHMISDLKSEDKEIIRTILKKRGFND